MWRDDSCARITTSALAGATFINCSAYIQTGDIAAFKAGLDVSDVDAYLRL